MALELVFITGNQNKADILARQLGYSVQHHKLDLDELQSLDLREVVEYKVRQAYDLLKKPVLVEDASLSFTAMGRLPGPFIKWFLEELGLEGLCKLAASLPGQEAHGVVCYALYDGADVKFFEGEMRGRIAPEARGEGGFGFDPIFINEGYDITRAEMDEETYAKTSYRAEAIAKLREYLEHA
jgi:non-canonical purine NTP pyrophosphatase (RdgB/HAM1 family)